MTEILQKMEKIGIIPVVVLNQEKDAPPLGKALLDGGLPCAEVTFRTDAAQEAIRRMAEAFPELLVGAGTVLTTEQVDRAVAAGAKFIVSPGLNPRVVQYCQRKGIPIVPGVATPSEIERALDLGLEAVKFFPAEPSGGLKMIEAMGAAYTKLKFMPTGGINPENVKAYLKSAKILACGGSWMVKGALIEAGQFEQITKLCREAAGIVKEIRG
ncbi:MAG: bifunctional 4-hydroxy-2-oxoglutarate aldolase/2-dehydro-3-deoxy-phosphogluconate aldolase [Lachnospiraceae bacterium]|nr:bifunctional 4-hydroxy-2-oxoglutarate aldolase/2-dehydro-3-deoxy-phosphogluconate aldolase [Lachnospiraceae bacterium]